MPIACRLLTLALAAGAALPALAARPMITDDARVVDAQACQVESWQRINRDGPNRFWAVPACNPTGNLELSVGGAQGRTDAPGGERRLVANLFQGKTIFRPLAPDNWGFGLAVGRSHDLPGDSPSVASNYFYVPVSWATRGDDVVLHLNLGLRDDRGQHRTFGTWGLGSEIRLAPHVQLIAETFGESRNGTHVHGGLRWWVVPDRVQVDATMGSRLQAGTTNRWMSLGLRLLSPPFLP